jgi:hypothetical protein
LLVKGIKIYSASLLDSFGFNGAGSLEGQGLPQKFEMLFSGGVPGLASVGDGGDLLGVVGSVVRVSNSLHVISLV